MIIDGKKFDDEAEKVKFLLKKALYTLHRFYFLNAYQVVTI
jgi:hypothetical protein